MSDTEKVIFRAIGHSRYTVSDLAYRTDLSLSTVRRVLETLSLLGKVRNLGLRYEGVAGRPASEFARA